MTEITSVPPFLDFLRSDGSPQTVESLDDARSWVQSEWDFWSWLEGVGAPTLGLAEDQRTRLFRTLRAARDALSASPLNSDQLAAAKFSIEQYAALGLLSASSQAAYIQSFRARFGDVAAGAAAAEFLKSAWGPNQSTPYEHRYSVNLGRLSIFLFELGLGKGINHSFRSSFEKLSGQFTSRAEQQIANARSEIDLIKAERDQASADRADWRSRSEKSWEEMLGRVNTDANAAIEKIDNTEKAFKEQMKLRSSVGYWSVQADKHRDRANWQKAVIILYATAVYFVGFYVVPSFLSFAKATALTLDGKSSAPLLITTGLAVFIVSVVLWVARILVRIFMEERHRALDAGERAVMAETYSALTSEGLVSEAERVLVLSTLFRPAGEGSAREEGPETLQHAILAKLLDMKAPHRPQ